MSCREQSLFDKSDVFRIPRRFFCINTFENKPLGCNMMPPSRKTWPRFDIHINDEVIKNPNPSSSSSFPLGVPVIWGRRYGCWSSLSSKPCLLHRPLSVLQSACPSCTHPSTLSLVSLSSFSPVSLSSSLSSLRDLPPSSWRAHTISVFSPLSFWTPALLSSFLGCVRSWFYLFLSLHTSTSASSSRSPQSLTPVVWWWPRFQLHIA